MIGDRTAGSVMQSRGYSESLGIDAKVSYFFSVTDADVLMKDGKSLERTGVTPIQIDVPSPADLAAGRDPVLAKALAMAGVKTDPVQAGQLFPFKWRPF